ncbi:MAG TPA: AmmeMemoRadiSam system protein B [Blastocatellia bacterium]|nr:AmmeMemoRadiSam system protein B [Blastocatellia bacterium]
MTASGTKYPSLRPVDARPVSIQGQDMILLRDPLRLSDKVLVVPQPLGPALALCDGTREDAMAIAAAMAVRFGLKAGAALIEQMLGALDQACLLDNDHFAEAKAARLIEYRQAPFRLPALAGQSYPESAGELTGLLNKYTSEVQSTPCQKPDSGNLPCILSPHIDYARGGPVYAKTWKQAEELAREAELVILLGTDHYGGDGALTLTQQNYATPFGVLPTATDIVGNLAAALGEESAYQGELRHCGEHSIELAAVWLHYIRDGQPVDLVPILCGSFHRFTSGEAEASTDPALNELVDVLKTQVASRNTLLVAAADLSHVGPAFGGPPVDIAGRGRLKESDDELIDRIHAADAEGFLAAITRVKDCNNVCGVSPIYVALKVLGQGQGELAAYDRCPADEAGTSLVSICGMTIT